MLDFGEINGQVNFTLWALEARKAMGDVEQGLAVDAWKLQLVRINPVGRHQRARVRVRIKAWRRWPVLEELRRQHLG